MDVLVVGGAGTIGATAAYTLSVVRPSVTVTLVDPRTDPLEGHAIDLRHSRLHVTHAAGGDGLPGEVAVREPAPELVDAADCVVVAASVPRPDGGAQRGGRRTFLEDNLALADELADWIGPAEPTPIVVVSNPVDQFTHRLWRRTGWPRRHFLGYSLSETARIADELGRLADTSPARVSCPVLGEHGEHVVPAFSQATVDGEPLELTADERERALEYVRNVPYDVIARRGGDETSRWVTGRGVAALVERLLEGGTDEPVCLSTPLAGEYGLRDVSLSVPVTLDRAGVAEIHEWTLADAERAGLEAAAESVRME